MNAPAVSTAIVEAKEHPLPPRERILAAARDLFYRHGIHAVGVDAIAEAAATNKMTLYRHFASKDALIAAYLESVAADAEVCWAATAKEHSGDPMGHLNAWLAEVGIFKLSDRGCAFANAAAELAETDHPARRVIERVKTLYRARILGLCRDAGLSEPELAAEQIFLLCEGARVCRQSMGQSFPADRLVGLLQNLVAQHACKSRKLEAS